MEHSTSVLLAEKRTLLAAVRTLLAFVRTGLVCVSVAFAFLKLEKDKPIDWITVLLFVVGALFIIGGIVEYFIAARQANDITRRGLRSNDSHSD